VLINYNGAYLEGEETTAGDNLVTMHHRSRACDANKVLEAEMLGERCASWPLNKRVHVLLGSGSASGTLAAVRNLGANGIEVAVLSSKRLSAAAWSRWGSQSYSTPPEIDSNGFLERLLAIGKENPGQPSSSLK
jgi:hypothetical protein